MIVSIRGQHRPFLLYGGAQIAILVVAAHVGTREAWYAALPLVAAASFWAWVANFRRYRAVGDTPTSTVASAAQGYVELLGRAYNHPGLPIYAKLSRKPCCWFRFEVEERDHEGTWRTVESGESAATFLLRDHTGECTVDPEGAEVVCTHKERRDIASDRRYTEWRIHEGDTLYVLGEFRTRTFTPDVATVRADTRELLAEWKREPHRLLARFDLDRNGVLDLREWELARAEARRQVERRHRELLAVPAVDIVQRPSDGRLFLLADQPPSRLARRFVTWSWIHLGLFFAAWIAFIRLFIT